MPRVSSLCSGWMLEQSTKRFSALNKAPDTVRLAWSVAHCYTSKESMEFAGCALLKSSCYWIYALYVFPSIYKKLFPHLCALYSRVNIETISAPVDWHIEHKFSYVFDKDHCTVEEVSSTNLNCYLIERYMIANIEIYSKFCRNSRMFLMKEITFECNSFPIIS